MGNYNIEVGTDKTSFAAQLVHYSEFRLMRYLFLERIRSYPYWMALLVSGYLLKSSWKLKVML